MLKIMFVVSVFISFPVAYMLLLPMEIMFLV